MGFEAHRLVSHWHITYHDVKLVQTFLVTVPARATGSQARVAVTRRDLKPTSTVESESPELSSKSEALADGLVQSLAPTMGRGAVLTVTVPVAVKRRPPGPGTHTRTRMSHDDAPSPPNSEPADAVGA